MIYFMLYPADSTDISGTGIEFPNHFFIRPGHKRAPLPSAPTGVGSSQSLRICSPISLDLGGALNLRACVVISMPCQYGFSVKTLVTRVTRRAPFLVFGGPNTSEFSLTPGIARLPFKLLLLEIFFPALAVGLLAY